MMFTKNTKSLEDKNSNTNKITVERKAEPKMDKHTWRKILTSW